MVQQTENHQKMTDSPIQDTEEELPEDPYFVLTMFSDQCQALILQHSIDFFGLPLPSSPLQSDWNEVSFCQDVGWHLFSYSSLFSFSFLVDLHGVGI